MRSGNFGSWKEGFVRTPHENLVELSSDSSHRVQPIKAAYEDIRIPPTNRLLDSVEKLGFFYPRSYSIVSPDLEGLDIETKLGPELTIPPQSSENSPPVYLDPAKRYPVNASSPPPSYPASSPPSPSSLPSQYDINSNLPDISLSSLDDLVGSYLISNHEMTVRLDLDPEDIFK